MSTTDELLISKVSFNRLATRSTNQYQESLPAIDQIPTARASAAMLDKLWTQIDVLDDVTAMAEAVKDHGSFFTEEFSSSICHMKESQDKLLDIVIAQQMAAKKAQEEQETRLKEDEAPPVAFATQKQKEEQEQLRMSDFFSQPPKPASHNPKLAKFDELDQYVGEVRESLIHIQDQMNNFDEVRCKLW